MPTPAQNYSTAIKAYNTAARGEITNLKKPADDNQEGEFANLVNDAIKAAVRIGERSENLSIQGISDKADISKVVTAVSEAELTLQTVVTVRDKVLAAYKEIMRMPI